MAVLSLTAVSRLAERRVPQANQPVPVEEVVAWLINAIGVQDDRARAGIRLGTIIGRLEQIEVDGRPAVRLARVGCEPNGSDAA